MPRFLGPILLLLLTLCGCENRTAQPTTTPAPVAQTQAGSGRTLLTQPLEPALYELPTDALPLWRQQAGKKPALVLFSFDPFLQPIPAGLREQALALARDGSAAEIVAKGRFFRADPLLLPAQALSAAIEAGFFSRIVWVFPSSAKPEQLQLELFRRQMTEAGFFTADEAAALNLNDGVYSGTLRGLPFQAAPASILPKLEEPLLLHLDLSYFRGLYQDEVKTPVYDLLHQTASALRASLWQPLAVSLSFSNEEGTSSLDSRFLLRDLAEIFNDPALLDGNFPPLWDQRNQALRGTSVFTPEKQLELAQKEVELAPQDPTARYDLYRALFEAKKIDQAIETLDQVVAADPGYAYAYAELAQIAINDRNRAATLALLQKAAQRYPDNPLLLLQLADVRLTGGDAPGALELLGPLQQLHWSTTYHADIPQLLERMVRDAKALAAKGRTKP